MASPWSKVEAREKVEEVFRSHDYPISAVWIANKTEMTKKDVNGMLYQMLKEGAVEKLEEMSPVLWRLTDT